MEIFAMISCVLLEQTFIKLKLKAVAASMCDHLSRSNTAENYRAVLFFKDTDVNYKNTNFSKKTPDTKSGVNICSGAEGIIGWQREQKQHPTD